MLSEAKFGMLEIFLTALGSLLASLGVLCPLWGCFGVVLGGFEAFFDPSWTYLGHSWGALGVGAPG